jgi:glutamate carboxypeptidase
MNMAHLGFNDEDMLAGLKPWVLCESPSYDPAAGEPDAGYCST